MWPWLLSAVALITVVAGIYWALVATPRYQAQASFIIRGGGSAPSMGDLASLIGSSGGSGDPNRHLLAFIPSAACFSAVDEALGLRSRWSAPGIDPLTRLKTSASREDALGVWKSRVRIRLDDATGLLELQAEGFTAEEAQTIARAVMRASEDLVNRLNQGESLAKARALEVELERSRSAIDQAVTDLLAFQDRHGLADAAGAAQAVSAAGFGVENELVQQRAALAEALTVFGEEAESVRRIRARLTALEREMVLAQARVAASGTSASPRLNQLAAQQARIKGLVELRQEVHRQLMASSIQSQAESRNATMHLAIVAEPVLPDTPTYPRFWYNTTTLLLVTLILAGIGSALWTTIRERMD